MIAWANLSIKDGRSLCTVQVLNVKTKYRKLRKPIRITLLTEQQSEVNETIHKQYQPVNKSFLTELLQWLHYVKLSGLRSHSISLAMTLKWKRTIRIGRSTENIQQSTFFGIQNDFCVFTRPDMLCYEVEVENGKAGEMSK